MLAMPPAAPLSRRSPAPVDSRPGLPVAPEPTSTTEAPVIVQTVTLTQTPARSDLLAASEDWTWVELRDYVVSEITSRFGAFPRDARKEHGIFSRFLNAYGADAVAIAKFAFGPTCDGWWGRAPISINRFCKASDPYFAAPILERLADADVAK